jgi:hypothetical protein
MQTFRGVKVYLINAVVCRGERCSFTTQPLYPEEATPVPIGQEAGRAGHRTGLDVVAKRGILTVGIRTPIEPP